MNKFTKIGFLGFLTWLIPFIVAFFFYSKDGKPTVDVFLFKSIMIIVLAITGAFLLIRYFIKINENYFYQGVTVGLVWLAINIIMDLIVLLPISKMDIKTYFTQIGLCYLIIPVMSISMGYVLA